MRYCLGGYLGMALTSFVFFWVFFTDPNVRPLLLGISLFIVLCGVVLVPLYEYERYRRTK